MGSRFDRNSKKEPEVDIVKKIKRTRGKDKKVVRVVKKIKKAGVKVLREDEQQIEKKLVLKEGKFYVLKNKEWKVEIIQLYHNILVVEYRGK